ncbi:MAG: acyl-CoA dehydrogenase family protein [Sphingomonas bacterium]
MTMLSPEDQAFAEDFRAFVAANLDLETRAIVADGGYPSKTQVRAWFRALASRNLFAHTWKAEHGGPGLTPMQQLLFEEIVAEMHAPSNNGLETKLAGPVIREFGNEAQRRQHLPGILDATICWCQGYSEPGAGSDLASLKTRAERDGDDYVVNGQKIWTSYAHWADWMFMLVRTSQEARRQDGISFLLVDMKTPGITVRPILAANGHHGFNEVFFDNVRVPVANRVGGEGKGWTYAKFLLSNERLGVVAIPNIQYAMRQAEDALRRPRADGSRLIDNRAWADRLTDLKVRLRAVEGWIQKMTAEQLAGGSPGVEVSLLKIRGTELNQAIAELAMDALGYDALPFDFATGASPTDRLADSGALRATSRFIDRRVSTILGGSTEIQKNIVTRAMLGL